MKNLYIAGMFLLLLASCNGNKTATSGNSAKSDSALTESMESPVAGPVEFFLTRDSIGPVRVGEKISDLPQAVANLYDVVLTTETPDAMAYTFLLADVPQFTIYDFLEGKVDVIALEGNARAVNTPDGELRTGDEFSKVLALKGVESEFQNFDDSGIWYWKWNGLYFGVDETGISESLGAALSEGKRPPRASEFTPDVKIGYIATGLPF
ncbi:MAG: hypothetical protein K2L59_02500 [Muribaculaceae bacterium]|nr:hypothetical protein [Muribaculaceae bacterium]